MGQKFDLYRTVFRELSDDDALPKSISTKTESYNKHAIRHTALEAEARSILDTSENSNWT